MSSTQYTYSNTTIIADLHILLLFLCLMSPCLSCCCLQVHKALELYEQLNQRMGVVIVGPSGSGKSTVWRLLKSALIKLGHALKEHTMNPKAMPRTQVCIETVHTCTEMCVHTSSQCSLYHCGMTAFNTSKLLSMCGACIITSFSSSSSSFFFSSSSSSSCFFSSSSFSSSSSCSFSSCSFSSSSFSCSSFSCSSSSFSSSSFSFSSAVRSH